MTSARELLLKEIEQLDEEKTRKTLEFIQNLSTEKTLERLKNHPAIKVPADHSRGFREIRPAQTKGIPASKLLIGDRR